MIESHQNEEWEDCGDGEEQVNNENVEFSEYEDVTNDNPPVELNPDNSFHPKSTFIDSSEERRLQVLHKRKTEDKRRFLILLEQSLGVWSTACKKMGVERSTPRRWAKEDPIFASQIESIKDITLDFAESALLKKIKEGDTASIIFYLKTLGRARGYIERPTENKNGDDKSVSRPTFKLPDGTIVEL